jgi:3-hydroxyisobutyrate dehydrogenase
MDVALGWVGVGRMGYPMVERLLSAGHKVAVWNRTPSKAEPLKAKGAIIVDKLADLGSCEIVFTMVATGSDLERVLLGPQSLTTSPSGSRPALIVDCSSIGVDESRSLREKLSEAGCELISAPVSGNAKCVKAGKLGMVVSCQKSAFNKVEPYLNAIAPAGVSWVGEGELARICKIAHNVLLGVVFQNLAEILILAQKAGISRHAFLNFLNSSVLGSVFTRYKSNALVNLDWTTTFTPILLRKDLDLGLTAAHALEVPMPVTAATREALQAHIGAAMARDDWGGFVEKDFAAALETAALAAGLKLAPENVPMPTGLEVD